jgi:hypothetical protein
MAPEVPRPEDLCKSTPVRIDCCGAFVVDDCKIKLRDSFAGYLLITLPGYLRREPEMLA